ncbi:MAG TPA: DNA polymerase I [Candidatus Butyricicoccus avistercoris]|uniref:DNA polymerase I n=1 Tax=Candidatus Butyricicoccus avistercoris TaxID=2838518 RepID=A0A9D1TI36_9FIRM|nr:DNA polymerase I [Candidatus Butyricicoccus avistercoris]
MKIMVIDGNSILNRAFYGVRLLTNHEGFYTNAIYGFLSTLFKLQDEEMPEHTIVCFDVKEKTFRHKKFETYKATRKGMPDELAMQLPVMKDILDKLGITRCEKAGYEADDLIGTISRIVSESSNECVIVTGDKDSLQLVGDGTSVRLVTTKMGQSTTTKYDEQTFEEEYGFKPIQLIDLKALMGDTSDNISGVAGIGKKTANDLIKLFGSIENIYKNIDSERIKKGVRDKLISGEQSAKDSYWLATIDRNAPLDIDPVNLPDEFIDETALLEIFNKLELKTFINRLGLVSSNDNVFEQKEIEIINLTDFNDIKNLEQENQSQPVFVHINKPQSAVCVHINDKYYIIKAHQFTEDEWFEILRRIFKLNVVMHDAKEQIVSLMNLGINTDGIKFDTCLAAYLLNPAEGSYDLQRVALSYCQIELKEPEFDKEDAFLGLIDNEDRSKQLALWTQAIESLYNEVMPKLKAQPELEKLYYELELPLMTVLADMQKIGCKVDANLLREFGVNLDERIDSLTNEIYDYAGTEFKINSPKQLGEILFDKLGLPVQKKTKSGYSTNAEVLEAIAGYHPIVNAVLEYRQLTKLKSTYVDGLLKVINPSDGRIHSHFQQTVTATGRLSSVDPNLQNIPVRTELGRELRKMFVAQDENHVLIDADYSQIELRVLAHIAQDEAMLEAFRHGADIHAATASKVYGVNIEDVTSQMRSSCKAVNFGIVYGISDFALAGDLGISRKQAGEFIKSYLETYTGVDKYMKDIKASAKEKGYVETLFGRRRYLPELSSKSFPIRSFGERIAMNTPIQGTAADIIKIAMLRVWKRLKSEGYKTKLILQVHDELILEAPLDEREQVTSLLTEEMQNAIKMDVPLVAEAHFGHDWYTAKG